MNNYLTKKKKKKKLGIIVSFPFSSFLLSHLTSLIPLVCNVYIDIDNRTDSGRRLKKYLVSISTNSSSSFFSWQWHVSTIPVFIYEVCLNDSVNTIVGQPQVVWSVLDVQIINDNVTRCEVFEKFPTKCAEV